MTDDEEVRTSQLPPHVLAEAKRVMDAEARRILDEQIAAESKAEGRKGEGLMADPRTHK